MSTETLHIIGDNVDFPGPDRVLRTKDKWTSDLGGAVQLRLEVQPKNPGIKWKPISIPTLVRKNCEERENHPALFVKRDDGRVRRWTYYQYFVDIKRAAKGFIKLGLKPLQSVAILSFNKPEWYISCVGAIYAGGVACGLYTTNGPETNRFILQDSKANILVVDNDFSLHQVLPFRNQLPDLRKIIVMEGPVDKIHENVITWTSLMKLGEDEDNSEMFTRLSHMAINQCAVLIYTSGTTGKPKGVMLSHDNIIYTTQTLMSMFEIKKRAEVFVSYLPLNHIAAQLLDIWMALFSQATVHFGDRFALKGSLLTTLREAKPTRFFGVPRVWEKIMEAIADQETHQSTGFRKRLTQFFKEAGIRHYLRGGRDLFYFMGDSLMYRKIKVALGLDQCKTAISGAAPLGNDVGRFFLGLDINVLDCYGMSETTGVISLSTNFEYSFGSVGAPAPGSLVKLSGLDHQGHGEICVWSRTVMMGYLNQPEKTKEILSEEGFIRTGDIAYQDMAGFLYMSGRIKDIIITAGGENVAPSPIEDEIKTLLPCVSNAVVIGDKQKYLMAFLTLKTLADSDDPDIAYSNDLSRVSLEWCQKVGSKAKTVGEILKYKDESVFRAIQDAMDVVNSDAVSNATRIQKWTILPKDFTVAGGELGPTMKLKRFFIYDKYQDVIDRIYST